MIYTVLGGFFGDEGKGKIVSTLSEKIIKKQKPFYSDFAQKEIKAYNVRVNGGPNGGHALEIEGKRISGHVLPSTITNPDILNVVGAGCALNPKDFAEEIKNFENAKLFKGLLAIDDNADLIIEPYKVLDALRSKKSSTGSGIRFVYGYKFKRTGLKARDLYADDLKQKIAIILHDLYAEYYESLILEEGKDVGNQLNKENEKLLNDFKTKYNQEVIFDCLKNSAKVLKKYISKTIASEIRDAVSKNKPIFTEGSQSYFLGIYSRLEKGTSSIIDPLSFFITQNIPIQKQDIYFVVKAFGSRVGNGYFVGEFGDRNKALKKPELLKSLHMENASKEEIKAKAIKLMQSQDPFEKADGLRLFYNEFGETTKRPRGKAPLDLVALRTLFNYTANKSLQEVFLVINQIDGLEYFEEIPLIVAYNYKGKIYKQIPNEVDLELKKIKPVITKLKSWDKEITQNTLNQTKFKEYIKFIEKETGFKVKAVGIGPKSSDILFLE